MSPDSRRPWIALTTPKKKNKPTFTELDLNDDEEDEDFDPNTAQVRLQSELLHYGPEQPRIGMGVLGHSLVAHSLPGSWESELLDVQASGCFEL